MRSVSCHFCKRAVRRDNGFLELYSYIDGRWLWPQGYGAMAIYTHVDCGPDSGYAIELSRIKNVDRPHGWIDQIEMKSWGHPIYLAALREAQKIK